ncbi:MAG TPA: hypothetical protein VF527_03820 [Pyrinomonadaceae bacterium]|jgi:hypothetical protein
MQHLFPNFLNDIQEYRKAQAFWKALCGQVLAKHHQSDVWRLGFHEVKLDDDSFLLDGNPIYALVNSQESKGVRIIQDDPKVHTKWEMAAWMSVSGDEHSEPGLIDELVFACNLTQNSAGTFEKLFETWIQPDSKPPAIEQLIKHLGIG